MLAIIPQERIAFPLLEKPSGIVPLKATQVAIETCAVDHARTLIGLWHSRLPKTQPGPWKFAFRAYFENVTYGVALWNNPSARMLPSHWLELRRLAISDDAPHCLASRMLSQMKRYFARECPESEKLISYQDMDVHTGTIYKAAGWNAAAISKPRIRDRSGKRPTGRMYRWNVNGAAPDSAGKIRWETEL